MDPNFVRRDAVLALHDRAIEAFGGLAGVRDHGLLDSALARPMHLLAYTPEDAIDLHDLAAAYAFAIAKNHAFHDGNKRTAWATCVLFLKANGVSVGTVPDAVEQMVSLASGSIDEAGFAAWLRRLRAV